jgi:hypothetical protein
MDWILSIRHYLLIFVFSLFIAAVILPFDNYLIIDKRKNLFAYAHIFSDTPNAITKNFDKYQLVFLPYPNIPLVNDNSTRLNFSLMENKTDVYGLFISLIIKDRNSGNVVEQIPYKFYEFGDTTFPYTFRNASNYIITFHAKINGDPNYKVNPLIANFDISVNNPSHLLPFDKLMIYYVTPATVAIIGIALYLDYKKKALV